MTEKLISVQNVFLDRINRICGKFGLNNIMAQLYAILYLSRKPVSLNDMVERLKISKGSASINIRALERYGAVKKVWVKGSRKDYYEAETDIAKVITDRIRSMASGRLLEVNDMVASSEEALNAVGALESREDKEDVEVFKQRLERLKSLQSRAQSLFNLFNSNLFGGLLNSGLKKDDNVGLNAEVCPQYEGIK